MARLPEPNHSTLRAIERAVEAEAAQDFRAHLGASVIGRECERALWYGFRWATAPRHSARVLRLFARGQREEAVLVELLRQAGIEVWEADQDGRQFRVSAVAGHFGGSLDGVALGVIEAPTKPHVLEFKTHSAKSYKALEKDGVQKSKPEHYAQMQMYMALMQIDRALYLAVNKDDDSLYAERIRLDPDAANALLRKAERIIASDRPPARISDDPAWFVCKFCDHSGTCHARAVPVPTCRSCVHATPEMDGDGRWSCAAHKRDLDEAAQLSGCESHAYIPDLLSNWAESVDADDGSVIYVNKISGHGFANGPRDYHSVELYQAEDLAIVGEPMVDELKKHSAPALLGDGERLHWRTHDKGRHLGLYRAGKWTRWVPQTPGWLALVEEPADQPMLDFGEEQV